MSIIVSLGILVPFYFHYAHCQLTGFSVIGKSAVQSTTHTSDYSADKALDGLWYTSTHTAWDDPTPWWRLDLGEEHCLGKITVRLRNVEGQRFVGAVARAGLSSNHIENQQCGLPATAAQSVNNAVIGFTCAPPVMSTYISFDIDRSRPGVTEAFLQLAIVTVEEYPSEDCASLPDVSAPSTDLAPECTTSEYFSRLYSGSTIGNPDPLSTVVVSSVRRCAASCAKLAPCASFDFAQKSGQCRLYGLASADIDPSPNDDIDVYQKV